MNKERRLFIFFGWKMLLQFYQRALIEVWYICQLYAAVKKNANDENIVVVIALSLKNIMKEQT